MAVGTFGAEEVVLNFVKGRRVLDIGCGKGKYGYLVKMYLETFYGISPEVVGLDVSQNILKDVKEIYDDVVCCDASKLPFRDKSFDTVIAAEVIEHLPKRNGLSLIRESERVAKNVIITTPSPRVFRYSPEHISLWRPSEFRKLGYRVYGIRRYPRTVSSKLIKQLLIAFIFHPLSMWFPSIATFTIAVKQINEH